MEKSGEYGVRWGFVNSNTVIVTQLPRGTLHNNPFLPLLDRLGWLKIGRLANGVLVYENPKATLPHPSTPSPTRPATAFAWGVVPMLSFVATLSLAGLRVYPVESERIICAVHSLAVSIIPLSLCFWFFQTIVEFLHPRVYVTYSDASFFFSDALVLFAISLWLSTRVLKSPSEETIGSNSVFLLQPLPFIFALVWLCALSILWSTNRNTSIYVFMHLGLTFLLILSLRDRHTLWNFAMYGLCVVLAIEMITGFVSFALQSTSFLSAFEMNWPGVLDPSTRGASVVQLENGFRILRAYGTLPHPNILGGIILVALLGPANIFLTSKKPNYPAVIFFSLGIVLLFITFSRSAWLGFALSLGILILKSKYLDRSRLMLFTIASILTLTLTFLPLRQLVEARTANSSAAKVEEFSFIGRAWLSREAIQMIREHPLKGVGIGSFVIELSKRAGEGYIIEPVHNIFLLSGSELGIPGLLILAGLFVVMAFNISKARTPRAILASATLTGLGIISLFDHYLWTLAPGRVLFAFTLCLWLGAIEHGA